MGHDSDEVLDHLEDISLREATGREVANVPGPRADAKGQGSRAPVGERFLPTIEALPDNLFGHVKFKSQPFWTHMKEKFSYCPETVLRAERIANNKVPLAAAGVKQ